MFYSSASNIRMKGGWRGSYRAWWIQDGAQLTAVSLYVIACMPYVMAMWSVLATTVTRPYANGLLWGYLKAKVYQTVLQNLQDLGQRITVSLCRGYMVRPDFDAVRAISQRCLALHGAQVEGRAGRD